MLRTALSCLFLLSFALALRGQPEQRSGLPAEDRPNPDRVRVFLDCGNCDMNYLRQEIGYIDYVRDPKLADVHVLVTLQATGGSSRTYFLDFIGRERFGQLSQRLDCTIPPNTPWDEERKEMARTLQVGLVPYLLQTGLSDKISVSIRTSEMPAQPLPTQDPWNFWVFSVEGSGNFRMEARQRAYNLRGSLSANRVTENWRLRNHLWYHYNSQTFLNEGETYSSEIRNQGLQSHVARSISDHWSVGASASLRSNTFDNMATSLFAAPAVEYSIFPYQEVNRREVTVAYRVGYNYRDYFETTIYGKDAEGLFSQSVEIAARIRQPWGNFFAGVEAMHFFHDVSKNRLNLDANLNLRLIKGLSMRIGGDMNIIRDQLALPAGDASLEDLLLQQRQIATGYRAAGYVGLDYTFGSIYNNVVNTRL